MFPYGILTKITIRKRQNVLKMEKKEMIERSRTSRERRIIGDILLVLAVFLTADVTVVMLRKISGVVLKADYQKVFRYQLILCAVLLLFALDIRFHLFTRLKHPLARITGLGIRVVVLLLTLVIVFFGGKVILGSMLNTASQADYAIVLGLALENGKPTGDLLARLNTAQAYLEKYPDAKLILTGGNADASGRTEADVMHEILSERGVAEDRMILEDQAESTKDNFRNTAKLIDPAEPVVLISSSYHMDRAVQTAENAGFTNILRLPAPSSLLQYGPNVLSEIVLEVNELTLKQ